MTPKERLIWYLQLTARGYTGAEANLLIDEAIEKHKKDTQQSE